MNRSPRNYGMALALTSAFFMWNAGLALAQTGVPELIYCISWLEYNGAPVSMLMVPDGSGTTLTDCFADGGRVNATLYVELRDAWGDPVENWPPERVRFEAQMGADPDQNQIWCSGPCGPPSHCPNFGDGPTDQNGVMTFTQAYFGGGWNMGGTRVYLEVTPGDWQGFSNTVDLVFNSPDINGDRVVNLADLALFAQDFFSPLYEYRSDFYADSVLNLSDLSYMAQAIGAACP